MYGLRVHWLLNGRPACQNSMAEHVTENLDEVTCMSCLSTKAAREASGLDGLRAHQAATLLKHKKRITIKSLRTPRGIEYRVFAGNALVYLAVKPEAEDWIRRYGLTAKEIKNAY